MSTSLATPLSDGIVGTTARFFVSDAAGDNAFAAVGECSVRDRFFPIALRY